MEKSGTIMHGAEMHLNTTRQIFVPPTGVYGTNVELAGMYGQYAAALLADAESDRAYATIKVPANFVSDGVLSVVVIPVLSGDFYGYLNAAYAGSGEAHSTNQVNTGTAAETGLVGGQLLELYSLALPNLSKTDIIGCTLYRMAGDSHDTINEIVAAVSFVLSYMADQ